MDRSLSCGQASTSYQRPGGRIRATYSDRVVGTSPAASSRSQQDQLCADAGRAVRRREKTVVFPAAGQSSQQPWRCQAGANDPNVAQFQTSDDRTQVEVRKAAPKRIQQIRQEIEAIAAGNAPAAEGAADSTLSAQLEAAVNTLGQGLVERDTEVRLMLLAALAGEHVLFIGPPGTAKSELGRRLARLSKGRFFERLLTRFSVPEELFGPLSMKALEEDVYLRQTRGYLPEAEVAFVDEIFKANSAILNSLLTLLNERLFDNGADRVSVPLTCLVGASNELPESEELDALYDRFLVRREVRQVSSQGVAGMLQASLRAPGAALGGSAPTPSTSNGTGGGGPAASAPILPPGVFEHVRQEACKAVEVPEEVLDLLADLRKHLQEECEPPVYVSDRRLVKSLALLQVAAYTSGRTRVSKFDCLLLQHVLWQRPAEGPRIGDYILQQLGAEDDLQSAEYLFQGVYVKACTARPDPRKFKGAEEQDQELARQREQVLADLGSLRDAVFSRLVELACTMGGKRNAHAALGGSMWLGQEEADAALATLQGKGHKGSANLQRLLSEIVVVEEAVQREAGPFTLAALLPDRWKKYLTLSEKEDVGRFATRPFSVKDQLKKGDPFKAGW